MKTLVMFIPVAIFSFGLGMAWARYLMLRWPEKNGLRKINQAPPPAERMVDENHP